MITADLISYIRKQQDNNISRDLILVKLATAGWHIEDINEGFDKVAEIRERENRLFSENDNEEAKSREESDYQSMSLADRYREPIDLDAEPLAKKEIPTGVKKKEIIEPKKDDSISFTDNNISFDQGFKFQGFENKQVEEAETSKEEIVSNKEEESKIELGPLSETEEIKPIAELVEMPSEMNNFIPVLDNKAENLNSITENKNIITEPAISSNVEPIQELNIENISEVKTEPLVEGVVIPEASLSEKETELVLDKTQKEKESENKNLIIEKQEDSLVEPVLDANEISAPKDISKVWLPKNIPVKEIESPDEEDENDLAIQNPELPEVTQSKLDEKEEEYKSYKLETLPKIAPVATYPKDVLTALSQIEKEKTSSVKKPINKRLLKLIAIILGIVIVAGGLTWAFATNKINLKNINIPFINKDPRSLILNNSKILNSLDSYKTETTLEIATPSFADISAGLLTGEAVSSLDKDNLILNSTATVVRKDDRLTSDNVVSVKGSIFQDVINARIHNDGQYLYLNFPDLSGVLKEPAPLFGSVKISEQEFYLIPSLFGPKTEKVINKLNLYKLLSSGVSSYVDQETLGNYDELIKKVQISKKGEELVKDIETYHYSINPDKELFKNLLIKIIERFSSGLSETDKENTNLLIGSSNISSFDVWIGKGDNTIYQYNIVLEIPMTKVLGFEDKSVGDNTMSISLKVTYSDFNAEKEILIPADYIPVEEFVKNTKIENIKNKVREFLNLANNLQKVEKKFGIKSNTKGSCMSPVSGSLFSPTGHPKTAVLPVSEISSFLNYTLDLTKGMGSCYSTTTDWSFAIPLVDNYDNIATSETYDTFYCIDNKGSDIEITALPSGVTCEQKTEEIPTTTGV